MANKLDIQYVRYYTDGSAARELQPELPQKKRRRRAPKQQAKPELVLRVDPLAVAGILVAAVMLILMAVGCVRLSIARDQEAKMEAYVMQLTQQNAQLNASYRSGYDPEVVRQDALGMGMIPAEQARVIEITLPAPQIVEEPGVWEQIQDFFAQLFA